ncbi:MAG: hypothetical protein ABIH76_00535, partial [Candidatus Bathyarchaeota archaeon]
MATSLIFVENNALEKLFTIAELMEDYEVRAVALSRNKWEEQGQLVIDDFYIEDEQLVHKSEVIGQTDHKVLNSFRRQNILTLGTGHSHGGSPVHLRRAPRA